MSSFHGTHGNLDRRKFLQGAGGLAAGLLASSGGSAAQAQAVTPESISHASVSPPMSESEKMVRIASNSYPIRDMFKTPALFGNPDTIAQMKKKYGEITMLDFPEFTKKTFPGVYQMDLWSYLFGDSSDESQFITETITGYDGKSHTVRTFDPSSASGKKWLETMAGTLVKTGTKCHHISNDAPQDICDLDPAKRQAGIAVAKKWLDGAAMLGAKSMRVNTGGPMLRSRPSTRFQWLRDQPRS